MKDHIALIVQLFVLINPLSSLPFLITALKNGINVRVLALNSVLTAYVIAVIIALIGPFLFAIFAISLDSFRIAGGLVLLLLGLDTIRGTKEEEVEVDGGLDSWVAIMATPLLTGPATMSFITIKSYEMKLVPLLLDISIAFVFVGIVFVFVSFMIKRINVKKVIIASKVLGLFLIAVAVEMIAHGIAGIIAAKVK